MKTKLVLIGLFISAVACGQATIKEIVSSAAVDTTSLSNRIDAIDVSTYVTKTDLADSAFTVAGDITNMLEWSDTTAVIATAYDLTQVEATVDTTTTLATQYYVGQRLDTLSLGFDEATSLDTIVGVSGGSMAVLPFETANVQMKHDTIPIFVFGLGGGLAADTAAFNDNAIAGSFYNSGSDTIHVTSLRGVLAEGSGTETVAVQVSWHATFKSGSATNLNAAAYTVTSITTGDNDTSFANSVIPPGVFVWCTISGVSAGNKPSLLILQLSGYKVPTY